MLTNTDRITGDIRSVSREKYAKKYDKYFVANTHRIFPQILNGRSSGDEWAR